MGVHSGKLAVINNVSHLTQWSISDTISPGTHITSASGGGTLRTTGVGDWSGSWQGLGPLPAYLPGDLLAFSGYTAPNDDVEGSDGQVFSGNAIIDSVVINWNWSNGESITHTVNFSGNGPLSQASAAAIQDAATPMIYNVCNLKVEFGTDVATTPTELSDVVSAALTINAANSTSLNSSSYDVTTGICWTIRRAGPIDWTLAMPREDDTRGGLTRNALYQWRLWTSATEFWELATGRVLEASNLISNRDGTIINYTENVAMHAQDIDLSLGRLVKPGGSLYWGEAA